MSNYVNNFMGGNPNLRGLNPHQAQADPAVVNAQANRMLTERADNLRTELQSKTLDIKYRKKDGTLTDMVITLQSGLIGDQSTTTGNQRTLKPGQIIVWSIDRDGWRNIEVMNIEGMSLSTVNYTAVQKPVTNSAQPAIEMSLAQQTALFYWISGVVHRTLLDKRLGKNVAVTFESGPNGGLRVNEKNSGLSIDL